MPEIARDARDHSTCLATEIERALRRVGGVQEARLISGDLRRRTLAACERPPAPEELARSVARWQAATDEEAAQLAGVLAAS